MASASEHSSISRRDSGTTSRPVVNLWMAGDVQTQTDAHSRAHQQSAQTSTQSTTSMTKQDRVQAQCPKRGGAWKGQTCKKWRYGNKCHPRDGRRCQFAHHLFPAVEWRAFDKADSLERCVRGTNCRHHWLDCGQSHLQGGSELDLYRMQLREYVKSLPYTAIAVVQCNACETTSFNIEEMLDHLQTQHPESYNTHNGSCPAPYLSEIGHDGSIDRRYLPPQPYQEPVDAGVALPPVSPVAQYDPSHGDSANEDKWPQSPRRTKSEPADH
ncbi:hypothetical protein AC579_8333 [Pseudocercospora musae]|uniref:C3H1-type domain-containing protein n=1 Tax=Pseudocercospora musae TaxID=113226 RepID=A0A139I732_9PEZI|nr:hypothetical protein AC579_8333 [Pseudocercospora musae]